MTMSAFTIQLGGVDVDRETLCNMSSENNTVTLENSDGKKEKPPELKSPPLTSREITPKQCLWSSRDIQSQLPTDILLITTNDNEFNACYSYIKSHAQRSTCTDVGTVDFGRFVDANKNEVKVALVKCAQGPAKAQTAVTNAAGILHPKAVIFVGVCATLRPDKAKLGDVVISAKLETYDDKKFMADDTFEYRNIKENVSKNMAFLIQHATDGWEAPFKVSSNPNFEVKVHREAVMLSGPELVNNIKRRQELAHQFKQALGLDMEGKGLQEAAYNLEVEWAVIKGVSDFADGKKDDDWQPFASAMAASVVHNMFKNRVVIEDWPHHKDSRYCTLL